jgi:acyl carrier protein
MSVMDDTIRSIVAEYGRLSGDALTVGEAEDLYRMGLTSHATVNVMLALEDAFDVEFPDVMLRKSTFQSVSAIRAAVHELADTTETA